MFTGIIKAIALVTAIKKNNSLLSYSIKFPSHLLDSLEKGASVSVDGVCQTVVNIHNQEVWFDAIEETLQRTTLHQLKVGSAVNLERSAKIGDEIGGHFLSGHIYGMANIQNIQENRYTFECSLTYMKYFFSKGFIAIDGISLTLVDTEQEKGLFSVHLIPETLKRTTLGKKKIKDAVNIEIDAVVQATVETIENYLKSRM